MPNQGRGVKRKTGPLREHGAIFMLDGSDVFDDGPASRKQSYCPTRAMPDFENPFRERTQSETLWACMRELAHLPFPKTSSTSKRSCPPITTSNPTRALSTSVCPSELPDTADPRSTASSTKHTSSRSPQRSSNTERARALMARSSSAVTPTHCPSPPGAPPSRFLLLRE